jgi:hypothetical protein
VDHRAAERTFLENYFYRESALVPLHSKPNGFVARTRLKLFWQIAFSTRFLLGVGGIHHLSLYIASI